MYTLLTILLIVIGIIFSAKQQNKRLTTLLVILFIVLTICYIRYMLHKRNIDNFTNSNYNFAPVNYAMSGGCSGLSTPTTNLVYPAMAPMAYDGLILNSTPKPEYPLISDVTIFSPVGDGIRLTEDIDAKNFPTVDGKEGSPQHLFMLAHNQVRPECCPSTYTTDLGCVCMTKDQINMFNKR